MTDRKKITFSQDKLNDIWNNYEYEEPEYPKFVIFEYQCDDTEDKRSDQDTDDAYPINEFKPRAYNDLVFWIKNCLEDYLNKKGNEHTYKLELDYCKDEYTNDTIYEFYYKPIGEEEKKKKEIINKILEEIRYVDIKPFSHNIINLELRILADKYGQEEANKLIENTNLKNLGWGYILDMK